MLQSIRHLLSYSWANLVAALGTTTLSILLFSFAIPLAIFAATVVIDWRKQRLAGVLGIDIVKASFLSRQTIISSAIYLVAWLGLLTWATFSTAHNDHVALLSRIRNLVNENKSLRSENSKSTEEVRQLKAQEPKTVTRTLPAPSVIPQCWLSNYFGMPNSTIKGAVTASATIIHCNHKTDAPYLVQVEFDRDFIPGAAIPLGSAVTTGGGAQKNGLVYSVRIESPALLSEQTFVVTVYGPTDQYPRALRGGIKALN